MQEHLFELPLDDASGVSDASDAAIEDDLMVGTAAEYLVCADLILSGYESFRTDQSLSYDVVCDVTGRLLRIQVKGTRQLKAFHQASSHVTGYAWSCRRGKGSTRAYAHDEFDILALVAVDVRRIAYVAMPDVRQTMHINIEGARRARHVRSFEMCTFREAAKRVGVACDSA